MTKDLTIYPAIDLKEGAVVRLLHGRMDKATVYNDDPGAQSAAFTAAGFSWVHIVDLDGALAGENRNGDAVGAIIAQSNLKMQLGGGVRDMAGVDYWLSKGLTRVILGTAAVHDPEFVLNAAKAFPGAIAIGIDANGDDVKTDGWAGSAGLAPLELAKRFEDCGVAAIIYTDISRDGALTGVNVEATAALADALSIPVIASGGVANRDDVAALARAHRNIEGVIIGRALYDGRITPAQAIKAASRGRT